MISKEELITELSSNTEVRFAVRRLQDLWNAEARSKFTINQEELPPPAWSNTETPSDVATGTVRDVPGSENMVEIFDGRGWNRMTRAFYAEHYEKQS